MSSEVLYRKWRPRLFSELAGQEMIARTLTNAVASGKVSHAYLFSGPRGTGKTTAGRLLAKALNCQTPSLGEPCEDCDSCTAFNEGRALDLVELDAASNRGIDEIRSLREKAHYAPVGGSEARKLYLVDEVHMLTEPAFNALLKTLEEPPPQVVFVLATTDAHKVPATVVSRCQRFDFRRIPLAAIVSRLEVIGNAEGFECPREGLEAIAREGTGSLRDAINLFEQIVDSYGRQLTLEQVREGLELVVDERSAALAATALRGELADGLGILASVRDDGMDLRQFQRHVIAYLRGLLIVKAGASTTEHWSDEQAANMKSLVAELPPERIVGALRAFGEADLRADPLSPLPLEIALATCALGLVEPPENAKRTQEVGPPTVASQGKRAPQPADPRPRKAQPSPEVKAGPPDKAARSSDNGASHAADLESVRARWPEIYTRTRELDHKSGALLNSGCGIIEVSDSEIVFGFKHQMLLDKMLADGGGSVRTLQQAVDEAVGAGRSIRCVLAPDVDAQKPPGRGGHLVRAAQEMGATVIDEQA
jgi:DNA polymerase-3 subunit gamma/tau